MVVGHDGGGMAAQDLLYVQRITVVRCRVCAVVEMISMCAIKMKACSLLPSTWSTVVGLAETEAEVEAQAQARPMTIKQMLPILHKRCVQICWPCFCCCRSCPKNVHL